MQDGMQEIFLTRQDLERPGSPSDLVLLATDQEAQSTRLRPFFNLISGTTPFKKLPELVLQPDYLTGDMYAMRRRSVTHDEEVGDSIYYGKIDRGWYVLKNKIRGEQLADGSHSVNTRFNDFPDHNPATEIHSHPTLDEYMIIALEDLDPNDPEREFYRRIWTLERNLPSSVDQASVPAGFPRSSIEIGPDLAFLVCATLTSPRFHGDSAKYFADVNRITNEIKNAWKARADSGEPYFIAQMVTLAKLCAEKHLGLYLMRMGDVYPSGVWVRFYPRPTNLEKSLSDLGVK